MQEIKTNIFEIPSGRGGRGISEEKEQGRECISNDGDDLNQTNSIVKDDDRNALFGGYGDYSEDRNLDIHEGKVLEVDTEARGVSTFVEIPMAGAERGRSIQTTGFQAPMGKGEAIVTPVNERRTHGKEISNEGVEIRGAEVVIQTGGLNILIRGGVQEATLRTVMKVVMDHA